jgi:hypothetical protein
MKKRIKRLSRPAREYRWASRQARRMLALLGGGEWRILFERLSGNRRRCRELGFKSSVVGYADYETNTIGIDFRVDLLSTIIHECFHILDDEADEDLILGREKIFMRRVSPRMAAKIYRQAAWIIETRKRRR